MREIFIGGRSAIQQGITSKSRALYYKPYNASKYVQLNIYMISSNRVDKTKNREAQVTDIIHGMELPNDYQEFTGVEPRVRKLDNILDMVDGYYKRM